MRNLSAEHEQVNKHFNWPNKHFPDSLEESFDFWTQCPPHINSFQRKPPTTKDQIEKLEKKLKISIPEPYQQFLMRISNGLFFTWSGCNPYIFPIEKLGEEYEYWREDCKNLIEEIKDNYQEDWKSVLFPSFPPEKIELKRFFPFGRDVNGAWHFLYTGAKSVKNDYPVLYFSEENYEFQLKNSSFANYLWFLNLYGHTHPQVLDKRLIPYHEKDFKIKLA